MATDSFCNPPLLELMDTGLPLIGFRLCSRSTHVAALLRATPTHIGAIPAVLRLVFSALISACIAYFGTCLTDRTGQPTAASHITRSHAADLGTVDVERDTFCHHFYVVLLQTCAGAGIASRGAGIAGLYAGLKLITIHHLISPKSKKSLDDEVVWLFFAHPCLLTLSINYRQPGFPFHLHGARPTYNVAENIPKPITHKQALQDDWKILKTVSGTIILD